MKFGFTSISGNQKTGPIPTVIVSRDSCPPSCELYNNGCYARGGMVRMHWDRVNNLGQNFSTLLKQIKAIKPGQLWRYGVAGDLPGNKEHININMLKNLVQANKGKRGFAYTHKNPLVRENNMAILYANDNGFTVNLSSNNAAQADEYLKLNIAPVVTVIQSDMPKEWRNCRTPEGNLVVRCLAEYNNNVTCHNCGGEKGALCSRTDRNFVVGFTAHGAAKRKASQVASKYLNILQ